MKPDYRFIDVAAAVLVNSGSSMHYTEIAQEVIDSELSGLGLKGSEPAQTLGSAMRKNPDLFHVDGNGYYSVTGDAEHKPIISKIVKHLKLTEDFRSSGEAVAARLLRHKSIRSESSEALKIQIQDDVEAEDFTAFGVEGREMLREIRTKERDVRLRAEAVRVRGVNCEVCGFNFFDLYGEHGRDFIEVHHLESLAERDSESATAIADLRVVCSNCHRILHRRKGPPMNFDNLCAIVKNDRIMP